MAGRQRGVVIVGAAVVRVAPVRRQRHGDVAEARSAEAERAVAEVRIILWRAPCVCDLAGDAGGQIGE